MSWIVLNQPRVGPLLDQGDAASVAQNENGWRPVFSSVTYGSRCTKASPWAKRFYATIEPMTRQRREARPRGLPPLENDVAGDAIDGQEELGL